MTNYEALVTLAEIHYLSQNGFNDNGKCKEVKGRLLKSLKAHYSMTCKDVDIYLDKAPLMAQISLWRKDRAEHEADVSLESVVLARDDELARNYNSRSLPTSLQDWLNDSYKADEQERTGQ